MTADQFAERVVAETGHAARRKRNGFLVRCPAHDDRTPSLSIGNGRDGAVLLRCHRGCEAGEIVAALGLSIADLFPSRLSPATGPNDPCCSYCGQHEGATPLQTHGGAYAFHRHCRRLFACRLVRNPGSRTESESVCDARQLLRADPMLAQVVNDARLQILAGEHEAAAATLANLIGLSG